MKNSLHKFEIFKYGFTFAEVLITLVIIGVVAALTISAVINSYVESSTVAKVKKGLSILGQAKKLAEVQNGSIEGWDFGEGATAETAIQFWNYLKPHISLTKDCGTSSNCYSVMTTRLNRSYQESYNSTIYYKFILADGSVMWFRTGGLNGTGKCSVADGGVDNVCALFWYDVNGEKSPNVFGIDIFLYEFGKDGVFPYLTNNCTKDSFGSGCSGYIMQHNNMKYLH